MGPSTLRRQDPNSKGERVCEMSRRCWFVGGVRLLTEAGYAFLRMTSVGLRGSSSEMPRTASGRGDDDPWPLSMRTKGRRCELNDRALELRGFAVVWNCEPTTLCSSLIGIDGTPRVRLTEGADL